MKNLEFSRFALEHTHPNTTQVLRGEAPSIRIQMLRKWRLNVVIFRTYYSLRIYESLTSSTNRYSTITSGGSLAWYYDKPNFQGNLTSEYLAKVSQMPTSSAYNPNGRGYPDVSALGDLYPIVLNGELLPVDGTSASTPFFAGVLSLLHDVAHANGDVLPSFINPILYESVSSFHDIVEGNNECGRASSEGTCGGCQCENGAGGWYALSGWDPVTGTFFLLCEYYYTRR